MKTLLKTLLACLVLMTLGRPRDLDAAVIPRLYNTGVDDNNALLANNAIDPHYTLVLSADTNSPGPATRTLLPGFPVGPWVAEGPSSRWIAPKANQSTGSAAGDYTYQTTFDLTGFDPNKATITGRWSSDNTGPDIILNGTSLGLSNPGNFGAFSDFTITSGFVAGTNILQFLVNNAGTDVNPTGLRVEMRGTVELPSEAPSIVTQPVNATVIAGESGSFTAAAEGTPPLSYQWRLNGTNIPGANDAVYTFSNVTLTQDGNYTMVVTNSFGSKTSIVATLTVLTPLSGAGAIYNTGVANDRTALDDLAIDPHYQLTLNPDGPGTDAFVEDSTVFPIVAGPWLANSDTSKWIGPRGETSAAAGGDYRYRIRFDIGNFDPATITIFGNWATDNSGLDILVNGAGSGIKNNAGFGTFISFTITNGFVSGTNTLDFVVNNAGAGYTGLLIDQLRGGGKTRTGPVLQAPRIVAQPQNATAFVGESVTLPVVADGSQPLAYQWRFNGQDLPGKTAGTLVLSNLAPAQSGSYFAVITNSVGTTNSAAAKVTVLETIGGLFNTGVGDNRAGLADNEIDPHYRVVTNAHDSSSHDAIVEDSTVFPIVAPAGPWVPDKDTVKWIGPRFDPNAASGDYVYRTAFVLDGFDPASVRLEGDWGTDNQGTDILVNGVSTGLRNDVQFTALTHFVITTGFQAGTNTVDFAINNAGTAENPTGLYIENLRAGAQRSQAVFRPALSVARSGNELTLSWPASPSGFNLFASPSLTSPAWTLASEPVSTIGAVNSVKIQISGSTRFFRLQK